jgi:HPt (histidine-containing phosphotransfer) domain-containing protein
MSANPEGQPSQQPRSGPVFEAVSGLGGAAGVCRAQEAIARLGGFPDLYADILGRFLNDKSGILSRLREAVERVDAANIHAAAHNLKGLAMMCGALSVAETAAALEQAGRAGADGDFSRMLGRLDAEMAAARIILAPYR